MVGNSLFALTVNCARCHSHKFDPIPQRDYYRLMALFTPAYNPENWKPVFPWKPEIRDRALPDVSTAELAQIDRFNADVDRDVARMRRPHGRARLHVGPQSEIDATRRRAHRPSGDASAAFRRSTTSGRRP